MNPLAVKIEAVTKQHVMTRGLQVSRGATCQCGYWTGEEQPGITSPLGFLDPLNWHRSKVIAEFLEGEQA